MYLTSCTQAVKTDDPGPINPIMLIIIVMMFHQPISLHCFKKGSLFQVWPSEMP